MIHKPSGHILELVDPTDTILNQVAEELTPEEIKSTETQAVIDRMLEQAAGRGHTEKDSRQMVGLAAPQLGVSKRIISIDVTADGSLKEQTLKIVINPKIIDKSAKTVPGREGCWSCGDICGNVRRAESLTLEGLDTDGESATYQLEGFVARIAQHETDHLDGIRFPDRIPLNEPEHLHWVQPEQFQDYREQWATWPHLCPREKWEEMKRHV